MNALGAYIYAGGFSLGIKHNFNVVAHLEDAAPYGMEVIDLNRDKYFTDLKMFGYPYWPEIRNTKIDLLFANPPCAPFSNGNSRSFNKLGWKNDPRIACWGNTIDYGLKNDIPFIAVESVTQMYSKAAELLQDKARECINKGYKTYVFLHNSCYMGGCQNRPRLMFIASKYELVIEDYESEFLTYPKHILPLANDYVFGEDDYQPRMNEKYLPAIEVLEKGERLKKAWERINPEEERVLNDKGEVKGRPSFGVRRIDKEELMNVVMGYQIIHETEPRYLTIKEYQVLGDYPADYKFPKKESSLQYVARGVSPKAGDWLGRMAKNTLEQKIEHTLDGSDGIILIHGLQGMSNQEIKFLSLDEPFPEIRLRTRTKNTIQSGSSDGRGRRKKILPIPTETPFI